MHAFLFFALFLVAPLAKAAPITVGGCGGELAENEAGLVVLSNHPTLYPLDRTDRRDLLDRGIRAKLSRDSVKWHSVQLTENHESEHLIALDCDRATALGILACELAGHGVTLTLRPDFLSLGQRGTTQVVETRDEGPRRIVSLSAEDFFTDARPMRSPDFLHELRHILLDSQRDAGLLSPYFGELTGTLASDSSADHAYAKYLSLTEFKTFHAELKQRLTKLRSAYLRDPDRAPLEYAKVRETFDLFNYLAARTAGHMKQLVNGVNRGEIKAVRDGRGPVTFASFASGNMILRLPVGAEDPGVRLSASTRMVFLTGRQLENVATLLARLPSSALSARAAAALIDQMQTTLNPREVLR